MSYAILVVAGQEEKTLRQRVKEYMELHKMSLTQFSKSVPCSSASISRLLNGFQLVNRSLIQKINDKLNQQSPNDHFEKLLSKHRANPITIKQRGDALQLLERLDIICKACTQLPDYSKCPGACEKVCKFGIIDEYQVGKDLDLIAEEERIERMERKEGLPEWHLSRGLDTEKEPDVGASDSVVAL